MKITPAKGHWVMRKGLRYFRIEDGDGGRWFREYFITLEPVLCYEDLEREFQTHHQEPDFLDVVLGGIKRSIKYYWIKIRKAFTFKGENHAN